MDNRELIEELQEEKAKILKMSSEAEKERERALAETLLRPATEFRENIEAAREARYQEMIDELPPIESPMDRRR